MKKWIKLALITVVWFAGAWAVSSYIGYWWAVGLIVALEFQSFGAWRGWWPDYVGHFINK
jgi:hypothetical protein